VNRSRNGNIFIFSDYWHNWSRILFHDAGGRGMERMRERYNIPNHIKTVEVDVTPNNFSPRTTTGWDRVEGVNIRAHSSEIGQHSELRGSLPVEVIETLNARLRHKVIDALLHVDLLRYIDWQKYDQYSNGGVPLKLTVKDFQTLEQYWSMQRERGGGPGLLIHDVQEDWEHESQAWQEEINRVVP
jgi:hypothetical protein